MMPQETSTNFTKVKNKRTMSTKMQFDEGSQFHQTCYPADIETETVLPPAFKTRLTELFYQIEKEFEALYLENVLLQEKVERLHERFGKEELANDKLPSENTDVESVSNSVRSIGKQKQLASQHKLKTAYKLKAQTSKIVSSFKTPAVSCSMVRELCGHKDGIWDVATANNGQPMIGTASAGKYLMNDGRCRA